MESKKGFISDQFKFGNIATKYQIYNLTRFLIGLDIDETGIHRLPSNSDAISSSKMLLEAKRKQRELDLNRLPNDK